jgi:DnaJ-domain-containing protein 1
MTSTTIDSWFRGRVDDRWFDDLDVRVDREEILVVGTIAAPKLVEGADATARRTAALARIDAFREETRSARMAIAADAEARFERKVSWGVRCDGIEKRFTVANVPVMTRLLFDERQVLDTLIDGGIARSRSEALAWCVKLVGTKQAEWIEELREALVAVEEVRGKSPLG